ncbi:MULTISPECIES: SDR family NAD(P)-dependent oxidoreductase [Pseudomonadaceae]|jgi:NAD(P)-dependent dehydrogenase (short-subunit alcohol dehydrogenase family)|uniref:SDR family oxidoreductase n=1 Tax=Ectopseudomonas toyotomiensis TaxID=554344 RepID=A0AA42LIF6_9GAMM|nr:MULTISPECIES: SDR family NAD(P)-dependent oxidoreductase [Pseudomonadaceae]RRU92566.1 SDR family oxidoreductase [Stutzerimonas xanthomarina]HCF6385822.1 SDR family oxidoreductase [Pseudomonas aeruginosa]MBA1263173.1 SDR family oxidoreductase [Stutzerimonas stutzeri]MBG0842166.1 SDR family oxidoreductase [Pseudomonas toyotomiensis]MDH0702109.1 SDR family oxidoreductase [Pseudomonas toyotomiensis]
MPNMVAEKVVVITGAGSGIGREFALAFAAQGARVVVNDLGRTESGGSAAEVVVGEIRAAGGEAVASTDSVSEWVSAQRIVQTAMDHFGKVDCVVNNAGIVRDRFFFKMSLEEWQAVIDVHLNGSFYVARAAAPYFKAQNSGAYIHMTSTSGLIGNPGQANYSAAKLGLAGLSKSIALDMARYNVRSNCIAPFAWTAMTASVPTDDPETAARMEKLKTMEPRKIAPLAVYLASDAGAGVSGQVFGVRANEIYLYSQPRVLRSVHRSDGWTPESIAEHAIPAMKNSFYENIPSPQLTTWDPI